MPGVWGGVEIQVIDPKSRRRSPLCKETSTPGFLVNKHQSLSSSCAFCIIPLVFSWGHLRKLTQCKSPQPLNLLLNCLIRNLLKILVVPFCLQIVHLLFCLLVSEIQVPWYRHLHHSVHAQEAKPQPTIADQICTLIVYMGCGCSYGLSGALSISIALYVKHLYLLYYDISTGQNAYFISRFYYLFIYSCCMHGCNASVLVQGIVWSSGTGVADSC